MLSLVDAVACEDTRRTGALLSHLGISKPLVRLDAHTMRRAPQVLERHARLAYVSDAGTPGISDPGAELVRAAVDAEVPVEVLPGATAFVPALVLSGLPNARFTFEGFLPRGGRDRRAHVPGTGDLPAGTALGVTAAPQLTPARGAGRRRGRRRPRGPRRCAAWRR